MLKNRNQEKNQIMDNLWDEGWKMILPSIAIVVMAALFSDTKSYINVLFPSLILIGGSILICIVSKLYYNYDKENRYNELYDQYRIIMALHNRYDDDNDEALTQYEFKKMANEMEFPSIAYYYQDYHCSIKNDNNY